MAIEPCLQLLPAAPRAAGHPIEMAFARLKAALRNVRPATAAHVAAIAEALAASADLDRYGPD